MLARTALLLLLVGFLAGTVGPARGADPADADAAAGARVALVVGNGLYDASLGTPPLPNAGADGRAMAAKLRELGFTVIEVIDGGKADIDRALRAFGEASAGADIALFYYAGHGLQMNGENYLLPIGAQIESEPDLEYEAVSLSQVKRQLDYAGARLAVMVLDACRDNPLSQILSRHARLVGRGVQVGEGLAPVQVGSASGMLIAYATAPGEVALDGATGHSPFTAALLQHIADPNVDVRVMFGRVRSAVVAETNGAQTPWVEEAVLGEFHLVLDIDVAVTAPVTAGPGSVAAAPAAAAPGTTAVELSYWDSARSIADPVEKLAALRSYLQRFPDGTFAELAALQIRALDPGSAAAAPAPAAPEPQVETAPGAPAPGDRDLAAAIQRHLDGLGYGLGPPDGTVAPPLRAAIAQVEAALGMPPTGEPSAALLAALRAAMPLPEAAATVYVHSAGRFEKQGDRWVEYPPYAPGQNFTFEETGRQDGYIYLRDQGRGMILRLPIAGGYCQWSDVSPVSWNDLYLVTPERSAP